MSDFAVGLLLICFSVCLVGWRIDKRLSALEKFVRIASNKNGGSNE